MRSRVWIDRRGEAGPTLVVTGAIHGNEPAGLVAAERVVSGLGALRGRVLVVEGNQRARAAGRRFLRRDLNRAWEAEAIAPWLDAPAHTIEALEHEDREQAELARLFVSLERVSPGEPLVFLDLHTTSGDSPAFVCAADTLANRELALAVRLPLVLGLEEIIEGTMLGWLVERGHLGVAVEGGRHDDPASVSAHEAALQLVLHRLGVASFDAATLAHATARLSTDALPRVLEIRHRHVVRPGDDFEMQPGFRSFVPVRRGALLARDRLGPIVAPEDALLLMPRYQPQGEDGFFLARSVAPLWLHVSTVARRLRAERWVAALPGVVREPAGAFRTTLRRPPPGVIGLMHLCGYRRVRPHGRGLRFERRREAARWPGIHSEIR
ncbi:MAG: succinylglutamate desuccinylase/aspartoacylase family protein [Myxococcales bacterium]|nr:succinylglutamate desuccinylase/aspartoacylase family protein [Myxococcales bacterium]